MNESGLPNCKGIPIIMLVVDRLSEHAHFIPFTHLYTTTIVAQSFIENVFKRHKMPSSIVSDKDPIFISALWREFFKLHGSELCMSFGYYAHSDGQTEVMNMCLETYLRCFVNQGNGCSGYHEQSGVLILHITLLQSTLHLTWYMAIHPHKLLYIKLDRLEWLLWNKI